MKITNLKSGIPYQLKPGTQLEVERTNPFFNEYGEQTAPLELPDTDQNRIALGYPDQLGSNNKPATSRCLSKMAIIMPYVNKRSFLPNAKNPFLLRST